MIVCDKCGANNDLVRVATSINGDKPLCYNDLCLPCHAGLCFAYRDWNPDLEQRRKDKEAARSNGAEDKR